MMALAALVVGLVLAGVSPPALAEAPQRADPPQKIVSINLCADQYLLALAAPEQILALSPWAGHLGLSFFANRARGHRIIRDDAESVLTLNPDLVLAHAFSRPTTIAMLRARGIAVEVLPALEDPAAIGAEIRRLAALLGQPDAGHAWAERHDQALGRLTTEGRARHVLHVLHWGHGGVASGAGSLMDRIFRSAGLTNVATALGVQGLGPIGLEQVIAAAPDLVFTETGVGQRTDQGQLALHHPALGRTVAAHMRRRMPESATVCPGPSLAAAYDAVADALRALPDRFARAQ